MRRLSLAESTSAEYAAHWAIFSQWCMERGVAPLPAEVDTILAYVMMMVDSGKESRIGAHLAAVWSEHRFAGAPRTTEDLRVSAFRRAVIRMRRDGPQARRAGYEMASATGGARLPRAPWRLSYMRFCTDLERGSSLDQAYFTMVLLATRLGLRESEVYGLRRGDVRYREEGDALVSVTLNFRDSKTGPFVRVVLAEPACGGTCAVAALRRHMRRTPTWLQGGTNPLFPVANAKARLASAGGWQGVAEALREGRPHPLAYKRDALKRAIRVCLARILARPEERRPPLLGEDLRQGGAYTAHSTRYGFAHSLAEAGVPLPIIAEEGHWRGMSSLVGHYLLRGWKTWRSEPWVHERDRERMSALMARVGDPLCDAARRGRA